jgi:hypothetical protein
MYSSYTLTCEWLLAQGGAHAQVDATQQQAFADYLQRVGEGAERVYPSVGEDSILIPHDMCCNGPTMADLIKEVYGALSIVEYVIRSAYIIHKARWLTRTASRVLQRGFCGAWGVTWHLPH